MKTVLAALMLCLVIVASVAAQGSGTVQFKSCEDALPLAGNALASLLHFLDGATVQISSDPVTVQRGFYQSQVQVGMSIPLPQHVAKELVSFLTAYSALHQEWREKRTAKESSLPLLLSVSELMGKIVSVLPLLVSNVASPGDEVSDFGQAMVFLAHCQPDQEQR